MLSAETSIADFSSITSLKAGKSEIIIALLLAIYSNNLRGDI